MKQTHMHGGNFYNPQITMTRALNASDASQRVYEHESAFYFPFTHDVPHPIVGNSARTGGGVPGALRDSPLAWEQETRNGR